MSLAGGKKDDFVCVSGLYLTVQKFRMKTCYEIAFGIFTFLNQLEIVLDFNDSFTGQILLRCS